MRGRDYLNDTLGDRPRGGGKANRIEFITEQYLQGKSSKLILIVLCPTLREAALRASMSFVLCE
ncbi:hypothetical protein [uncultured Nostoc sp.]|uniref:hypothetical protein n=1 Tax=uncultured Nostoc sp. TaxID=340711 RepID=UPI0035CB3B8C